MPGNRLSSACASISWQYALPSAGLEVDLLTLAVQLSIVGACEWAHCRADVVAYLYIWLLQAHSFCLCWCSCEALQLQCLWSLRAARVHHAREGAHDPTLWPGQQLCPRRLCLEHAGWNLPLWQHHRCHQLMTAQENFGGGCREMYPIFSREHFGTPALLAGR